MGEASEERGHAGASDPGSSGDGAALICMDCGYELIGLNDADRCPECGRAIADSIAWMKGGTPWQRDSSIRTWCVTLVMSAIRPRRTALVIASKSQSRTIAWNLGIWCICMLAGRRLLGDHYLVGLPVLFVAMLALASFVGLRVLRIASDLSGPTESQLRRQVVGHALFPLVFSTIVFHVIFGVGILLAELLYELLSSNVRIAELVVLGALAVSVLIAAWGVVASVRMCRVGAQRLGHAGLPGRPD